MTPSRKSESDRIHDAIEWRVQLESSLISMITELEAESRELPISLERIQVRSALKALERAHATCTSGIAEGQRAIGEVE